MPAISNLDIARIRYGGDELLRVRGRGDRVFRPHQNQRRHPNRRETRTVVGTVQDSGLLSDEALGAGLAPCGVTSVRARRPRGAPGGPASARRWNAASRTVPSGRERWSASAVRHPPRCPAGRACRAARAFRPARAPGGGSRRRRSLPSIVRRARTGQAPWPESRRRSRPFRPRPRGPRPRNHACGRAPRSEAQRVRRCN